MTQRTAARQRQNDFCPLLARGIVVTPAKAGVYCVLFNFETGWNAMDTGRVSPTKIFNFCRARLGGGRLGVGRKFPSGGGVARSDGVVREFGTVGPG